MLTSGDILKADILILSEMFERNGKYKINTDTVNYNRTGYYDIILGYTKIFFIPDEKRRFM